MASLKPKTTTTRKKHVQEEKIPGVHVGITLREAREAQNLSLDNVADELMIRLFYLQALENGHFKDLPERVYAIGFVKNYAHYLGLQGTAIVDQFKRDAYGARHSNNYQVELAMPEPVTHSIVPNRSAIISAVIVLVALIAGIIFFTQNDKKTTPVIPAPITEAAPAAGNEKPAAPAPEANAESTIPPDSNTTTAPPEFTSSAAAPATLPNNAVPVVAALVVKNHRVVEALQSSWVEIKDASGKTLFTNILKTGQLLPLPENTKVLLTTGNAGGLRLVLDGVPQPALGTVNEVKRNLPIEASVATSPVVPVAPVNTAPAASRILPQR